MSQLPSIVDASRLSTKITKENLVVHRYVERGSRNESRREIWATTRRLGGGSYGTVFLQKCVKGQTTRELRALKAIPMADGNQIDWRREIETIMEFSHPTCEDYFVKSLGWFQELQNTYIAMEYLEHGDLESYLRQSQPLPEDQTKEIAFQLLSGLRYMHGRDFAHRDLKPGNIMIQAKPPDRWWVKIGDFGLSKRIEATVGAATGVRGTLAFMAPELIDACNHDKVLIDAKPADIWSLGEIMFRLLTQRPVFDSRGIWQYIDGKQDLPVDALDKSGCSTDAISLFRGLMARSPETRFTAEAAHNHEWLAQLREPPSSPGSSADSDIPDLGMSSLNLSYSSPQILLVDPLDTLASAEWTTLENTTKPHLSQHNTPPNHQDASKGAQKSRAWDSKDVFESNVTPSDSISEPGSSTSPLSATLRDPKVDIKHSDSAYNPGSSSSIAHTAKMRMQLLTRRLLEKQVSVTGTADMPFHGTRPTELSFPKGARIEDIEPSPDNPKYLSGRYNGRKGLFPPFFVTLDPITAPQNSSEQSATKTQNSFGRSTTKTKAEPKIPEKYNSGISKLAYYSHGWSLSLSFPQGVRIYDITAATNSTGLYWGRYGENKGNFPSDYVQLDKFMYSAKAEYEYEAQADDELSFPENAYIYGIETLEADWWFGRYNGKEGMFPSNYVTVNL